MEKIKVESKEKTIVSTRSKGEKEWKDTEIDTQPMTFICHKGDIEVKPKDDFLEMNPEVTVYHGERVNNIDPMAAEWIEHILGYPLVDKEDRAMSDKHVIGLCDLSVKLTAKGAGKLFVSLPETYLHPAQVANISDFFITLNKGKFIDGKFIIDPPKK